MFRADLPGWEYEVSGGPTSLRPSERHVSTSPFLALKGQMKLSKVPALNTRSLPDGCLLTPGSHMFLRPQDPVERSLS